MITSETMPEDALIFRIEKGNHFVHRIIMLESSDEGHYSCEAIMEADDVNDIWRSYRIQYGICIDTRREVWVEMNPKLYVKVGSRRVITQIKKCLEERA